MPLFLISYNNRKYALTFRDFIGAIFSIKSVDCISVLWRAGCDRPLKSGPGKEQLTGNRNVDEDVAADLSHVL
jgi:hypothetical protein